jgi:beta-fructofuranosidase
MSIYEPPGWSPTTLGDSDVIAHDGAIHLFHLTLPNHDLVSHAVSRDGITWQPLPPALRTGDPGECDDDMIWTMHVVRHPASGRFHMYYTGCSTVEAGNHQRVALAFSDDLVHWTKHDGNPVLESKGPYYNDDFNLVGMISFRDPFVFIDDDVWHLLVTGRVSSGPRFFRGSVAHATSADGIRWQLRKPLYAPGQFEDMEVISMLKIEGRYYLTFHDFNCHTLYRMADSLDGPWRAPLRDQLLPDLNCVFRFCQWKGRTLMYCWVHGGCDWKRRQPGAAVNALCPPREVHVAPDSGELELRSFSGWADWHVGAPAMLPGHEAAIDGFNRVMRDGEFDDFIAETDVRLDSGRKLGLIFRCDAGIETAVWLRLNFAEQRIDLWRHSPYDSNLNRWKIRKEVVQSIHAKLEHGRTYRLKLLCHGPYIEVSLNDVVHLSAVTYRAQRGLIGSFIEDGRGSIGPIRVQPLRASAYASSTT